jgi:hypothetical protein
VSRYGSLQVLRLGEREMIRAEAQSVSYPERVIYFLLFGAPTCIMFGFIFWAALR